MGDSEILLGIVAGADAKGQGMVNIEGKVGLYDCISQTEVWLPTTVLSQ